MTCEITEYQCWLEVHGERETTFVPLSALDWPCELHARDVIDAHTPRRFAALCARVRGYSPNTQIYRLLVSAGYGGRLWRGRSGWTPWEIWNNLTAVRENLAAALDEAADEGTRRRGRLPPGSRNGLC